MSAEADPLVGSVLAGRYRIVKRLGEGAMGVVYLGEHVHIGRREAVKVLRPALARDAEAVARFRRGAAHVSAIHHPNVCTLYDFGDAGDGRRFLSMEYVPGEPLDELLARERRLPPARAVAIAAQVAHALQAAHDAGIVHRDLKPGNVMVASALRGGDVVKVVDFDIAKEADEGEAPGLTRLGLVIGTPEYMSPEQLMGGRLYGSSDVYALALLLYEAISGVLPGRGRDLQDCLLQRLAGPPPPLDAAAPGMGAPPALQRALDRALQTRPDDRFPSAAAFGDAITASLSSPGRDEDDPGRARTRRDLEPARRDEERAGRGSKAWGVAALVVGIVGGGGWIATRILPPDAANPRSVAANPRTATPDSGMPAHADSPVSVDPADADGTIGAGDSRGPPIQPLPRTQGGVNRPEDDPSLDASSPTQGGVNRPRDVADDVSGVLADLEDRVGPPYPDEVALGRIREAARGVWEREDRIGDAERARAAFILAHASLAGDDVEGCVRWAEAAVRLRPGGARQVLLDECRRVRG